MQAGRLPKQYMMPEGGETTRKLMMGVVEARVREGARPVRLRVGH